MEEGLWRSADGRRRPAFAHNVVVVACTGNVIPGQPAEVWYPDREPGVVAVAYGIPASQISDYELDYLIDLAAGGACDIRNLWPEPNTFAQFKASAFVHEDKDAVEAYTLHAICAGKPTVTAVQTPWSPTGPPPWPPSGYHPSQAPTKADRQRLPRKAEPARSPPRAQRHEGAVADQSAGWTSRMSRIGQSVSTSHLKHSDAGVEGGNDA